MTPPSVTLPEQPDDNDDDDVTDTPVHATLANAIAAVPPHHLPALHGDRLDLTAADGASVRMVMYKDLRRTATGARSPHAQVLVVQALWDGTTGRMAAFLTTLAQRFADPAFPRHAYVTAVMAQSVLPDHEPHLYAACQALGFVAATTTPTPGDDLWLHLRPLEDVPLVA